MSVRNIHCKIFVPETTTMIAKEKQRNVTIQIVIKCKNTNSFNVKSSTKNQAKYRHKDKAYVRVHSINNTNICNQRRQIQLFKPVYTVLMFIKYLSYQIVCHFFYQCFIDGEYTMWVVKNFLNPCANMKLMLTTTLLLLFDFDLTLGC